MKTFTISKKCSVVYECYKLSNWDIKYIAEAIWSERVIAGYETRSIESYIAEIKAHKRLYKLHILRLHTCDADLEEPISKVLDFLYRILGV